MMDWTGFEKIVRLYPAWDKRNVDPSKDYGIHGVNLFMLLKGPIGAVQFVIYTNWQLPHVQAEFDAREPNPKFPYLHHEPMAADLGYHSPFPHYERQKVIEKNCEWIGGPCYYDGSTTNAVRVFNVLRSEGDDGVWRELWKYWYDLFGGREVEAKDCGHDAGCQHGVASLDRHGGYRGRE